MYINSISFNLHFFIYLFKTFIITFINILINYSHFFLINRVFFYNLNVYFIFTTLIKNNKKMKNKNLIRVIEKIIIIKKISY